MGVGDRGLERIKKEEQRFALRSLWLQNCRTKARGLVCPRYGGWRAEIDENAWWARPLFGTGYRSFWWARGTF